MPILSPAPSSLDKARFVEAYGSIYEHSPWVAEAVYDRVGDGTLDTPGDLHTAMAAVVDAAPATDQLALIRAHPDLAGKAAIAGNLSAASTDEQAGAGLDQCTPAEFAEFEELNDAYRRKFGFPFIIAVKGKTRGDILAAFRARLQNDFEAERAAAMEQIHRIALFRLKAMTETDEETAP